MALRYLRRSPKTAVRKRDVHTRMGKLAVADKAGKPALEIAPDECAKLAKSIAYFCVACGREHASGDVRDGDLACAEAEIVALIRRAQ